MSVLFLMIPMSLLLGIGFTWSFLWATQKGQFDDLETPAMRMLNDDDASNMELQTKREGNQTIPLGRKNNTSSQN